MIFTNPVLISVCVMYILCLFKFNILLAILLSGMIAGLMSDFGLIKTMEILINGMQGNLETALSYILLGAVASAISGTNLTAILIHKISSILSNKKTIFVLTIAFIACFSQNLIPVHIAFIPILIPPLLKIMNKLKIDRRAVACALTFGLQAPYISLGVGFGLLFYNILKKELANNSMIVSISDIQSVMWIGGVAMFFGLMCAILFYRKSRQYTNLQDEINNNFSLNMGKKEWVVLIGSAITFGVQIYTSSIPLGGLLGLLFMIIFGGIDYNKVQDVMDKGLSMMAYIAFIMLVAAGFGAVLRESGGINDLISVVSALSGGKFGGALLMLLIGLLVTMGIGTSFGTIPIIAAIYVPLCVNLGFSVSATILLIGISAAIGDAGSPASDSTLGPTAGLNADGQHDHIYDTCVPTFVFFNIPMIIFALIFSMII